MIKSKFTEVIKTFTDDEIIDFRKFLYSPYFNRSEVLIRFYDLIMKRKEHIKNGMTKEELFEKLYPGRKYSDTRMRNLLSDLYTLSLKFISLESYQSDKIDLQKHLLKALQAKKLSKEFENKISNTIEKLENTKIKDEDFCQAIYLMQLLKIDRITEESNFPNQIELQKYHDRQFEYFLIRILRTYLLLLYTQKNLPNQKFEIRFLSEVIDHIKTNNYESCPLISIYYNMILLLLENREENYLILKSSLNKHYDLLGRNERYGMYFHLINFCIHKKEISSRSAIFEKELFDLYKTIIDRKIYKLKDSQYFDNLLYNNIVTNALRMKEIEYAEKFMNDFKDELSPEHILITYHICYALLLSEKSEYIKAVEILSKLSTTDVFYEIKIKFQLMKLYYELEYFDSIITTSDTFRHFLHENKSMIERHKTLYTNFINVFNKLVNFKLNKNNSDIILLEKEIIQTENLIGRDWLLVKFNALK